MDAIEGLERGMTRGLTEANAALTTPEGAELAPLLAATDLPELPSEGPLGSIGVRLDREADLLRNVALRELARVGWMERISLMVIIAAVISEIVVAGCATLSAMMGGDGRVGLFALAALILAGAAGGTTFVIAKSRAAHRQLAAESLTRARKVEERIFRLALVMEWRLAGPELYQDALARLERDVSPPTAVVAEA
jgi:hypothetical protein